MTLTGVGGGDVSSTGLVEIKRLFDLKISAHTR